jgi:hypothetical protein
MNRDLKSLERSFSLGLVGLLQFSLSKRCRDRSVLGKEKDIILKN